MLRTSTMEDAPPNATGQFRTLPNATMWANQETETVTTHSLGVGV